MHFSKTYSQLLLSLPPELRDSAIEYRQLKKLINQVVTELTSLGLSPSVIRKLLEQREAAGGLRLEQWNTSLDNNSSQAGAQQPVIVYEFTSESSNPELRLRLSFKDAYDVPAPIADVAALYDPSEDVLHGYFVSSGTLERLSRRQSLPCAIRSAFIFFAPTVWCSLRSSDDSRILIIPLRHDTAFFRLLTSALSSLFAHLDSLHDDFTSTLTTLAASISSTARPASSSAPRSFSAYSITASNVTTLRPRPKGKTDLYTWREIFQLYIEAEIFEGVGELDRGDRTVEESENRLRLFENRIQDKKAVLKLTGSRDALDVFLKVNLFILNVKKLQFATKEATRKILKKHSKRTALPLPSQFLSTPSSAALTVFPQPSTSLSRLLVQAVGETLLPIIPHIDDYACLICTSIAFKPIRLGCGHLFCVRCLVKLQKRGKANCPMCRAPTVLKANRSNVDYALLNFMADWFPLESLAKLRANEREAAQEELEELGLAGSPGCLII
ncbi:hypothetical protein F5I97DRAFT_1933704 [Phlebopus sp. FC_14]|nr:hypothetical protein F5I97DRAFT_1933704 [Phlebopus sp. FC_14]